MSLPLNKQLDLSPTDVTFLGPSPHRYDVMDMDVKFIMSHSFIIAVNLTTIHLNYKDLQALCGMTHLKTLGGSIGL